ncbi:MAG: HDOD domain-containing protein [Planctomycetota bacterium]
MSQETFIARQPIFDRRMRVRGYELLHRSGWNNAFSHADPDMATVELLNTSLLVNRLTDLTDGKLGFVNVTRNLLLQDFIRVMPSGHTVIEILETVEPDDDVVRAVMALKSDGHLIALDDYVDDPKYDELVRLADFVKVDFMHPDLDHRRRVVEHRKRDGLQFLAEKVETHAEFEEAKEAGYSLFQGYFFAKPTITSRRDLPRNKGNYVQFLREMARAALDIDAVEEIIKREISLSTKLLRYLNSVHFGVRTPMRSIRQALLHLGEVPLKRWGTLIALSGLGDDKPLELVRLCLVRARFCELLACEIGADEEALDHFLTGLFSALDALVDRPLDEALADMGLKDEIGAAIRGQGDGSLGRAFHLAVACEHGDVVMYQQIAKRLGLFETAVAQLYAEALFWADSVFRPALLHGRA